MIRHIVTWTLKETAEGATRAETAAKLKMPLEGYRHLVPGILPPEAGVVSTFDVALVSDFADKANKAALDAYRDHPDHRTVKRFVGAVAETRQCVGSLA
ncbi:stress responsive protein [Burkholderia sp. WAC0059]|uniref:Dabb family protein n=1 Tax=Burkholderia sp. WAC0059 TaxID=2066022 RepID=UPI000C7EED00|nr:Dabb family protein [Burkholderia sp. WAC0059]PLZ03719.1 stress responsive protein [Burkholderia sp. WAC0059]